MAIRSVISALQEQFPGVDFRPGPLLPGRSNELRQICLHLPSDRLIEIMTFLRENEMTRFEQLSDLTCVDYLRYPGAANRFAVVYSLLSISLGHRLWIKCLVDDPAPTVPSVTGIWPGADWLEREVYDLFGISFTGHPDLRRLMTWEGFTAHPLRKDYPLRGQGERQNYEVFPRDVS